MRKNIVLMGVFILLVGCSDDLIGNGTDTGGTGTDSGTDSGCLNCTEGDGDGDGVADEIDNCPGVVNADQTDDDADGVGNACDNCLTFGNTSQLDADNNGVGDACEGMDPLDPDGDGVKVGDNCTAVANANQEDKDSDGVGDVCDNCPSVENRFQEDLDLDGTGDHCETAFELPLGTPICASGSSEMVRLATNLYILLDLSGSMDYSSDPADGDEPPSGFTPSRWEVIASALDGVSDELATGFNIGMGGFGNITESGGERCEAANLPYELLEMQAGREGSVIRDAYSSINPSGYTPTATALEQVLAKKVYVLEGDAYAEQRTSAVVLITDGQPNSANDDCNNIADVDGTVAAAKALNDEGIPVYVIGITGVEPDIMEAIAVAGGGSNRNDPNQTWFAAADVDGLRDALVTIAGASIGCTLSVAKGDGGSPDWGRSSVVMHLTTDTSRALKKTEYSLKTEEPATMTLAGDACTELQTSAGRGEEVALEIRVACTSSCGTEEICGDGIDNNCNGTIDEDCGVSCLCIAGKETCGGDCPSDCTPTPELCDNKDNDCDGIIDEDCCEPQEEICDKIDNDCDGFIDEGCGVVVE